MQSLCNILVYTRNTLSSSGEDLGQEPWIDISEILKPASASFSSCQTPNRDILVSSNVITIACVTTLRTKGLIISVSGIFSK